MSVNQDYLDAVIKYLSVLEEEDLQLTQFNGKDAYQFHCPFCNHLVQGEATRAKRTAKLIRVQNDEWIFTCSRGFHKDCRGGYRSFHNFLLMLHPQLFREYQEALGMTDPRNHKAIKEYNLNHRT